MDIRSPREIWEAALGELQLQMNKPNFRTWFEKTRGLSFTDRQFVVGVPNAFVGEFLERNQRSLIEKVLIGLTGAAVEVSFQVDGTCRLPENRSPGTEPARAPRLNPQYSFETFIEGSGNRLARSAALAVAQNPGHAYNPLFIHG
ncbi:MAG: DnaA/Hda family protein, partial [Dehalococcoidales bacterium]|nr:DnaA/Hda family protein [Dehalococcoidales bacterium]